MDRLKSAYLLAIIALVAVPAAGQETAPPDTNACTFAVVGDIENCRTYSLPGGTPLTVRQAVLNAGLASESVKVVVIRSAQDRPEGPQFVSATSADNGERVESGDVLVVQAMSPLTAEITRNAAVRSDLGVAVVSLEHDGIVFGDVLQQTQTLPPADGQLKVICRFSGQAPITKAELWHPTAHGDVISISRSNRVILKGLGSMSPSVSERKSGGARDPFKSITLASSNHSSPGSHSMRQPLQMPTSTERSNVLVEEDGESPENTSEPDHELQTLAVLPPALSVSPADDIEDNFAADSKMSLSAESMADAPTAPSEIRIEAVTRPAVAAFNPWNLVFICGLLLSGTLILAGTLKPEHEDDTASGNAADWIKTAAAGHFGALSASRGNRTEGPGLRSETVPVAQPAETLTKSERPIQTDTAVRDPSSENAIMSDVESVKSRSSDEQSFSELEDLLLNRMPIDVRETPRSPRSLRVALFGNPAGPGCLRIDKAHPTISAPQMNVSPHKGRAQTAVPPNVAVAHAADSCTPSVVESSGSLDRALHFLQERTES